jgi:hypothetical protein
MRAARTILASLALAALLLAATGRADGKPLLWKPVLTAFLRVNDQPVKQWNVFQIEKKNDRFLVEMNRRLLLVDAEHQQVFELMPAGVERSGSDILWDPDDKPEKPLAASMWLVRDVGMAQRIKVRLDQEDATVDLQIPHPPTRR